MNKKALAALVSTLAFGSVTVASAGEGAEKPAAEKTAKKGKKEAGEKKEGGDAKKCGADGKKCSGEKAPK